MTIWQNYISTYRSMLPCKIENLWASWSSKGTCLNAIDHSHSHLLKSRQVDISAYFLISGIALNLNVLCGATSLQ